MSSILNDHPAEVDALGFEHYRDTLVDIVISPETQTPLTIGIFGAWGSGKTSLMRMIRSRLEGVEGAPKSQTVWFDAWKYTGEDTLWRALLLQVLAVVRGVLSEEDDQAAKELDDLEASLYRTVEREELGNLEINWGELLKGSIETAIHTGIALVPGLKVVQAVAEELAKTAAAEDPGRILRAVERAKTTIHKEHVQSLEQFQRRFHSLVDQHIAARQEKLVIFIDDLDRCLPEKAISVLEAIKLFLDVPGCIFVLGLDQKVIARSIEVKYRDFAIEIGTNEHRPIPIDGIHYLEKIIQLPFVLPPIEPGIMTQFVSKLVAEWPDKRCAEVFSLGLAPNPRQVKRTINTFLLLWRLADKKGLKQIAPVRLAKIVSIQHNHPDFYQLLREVPRYLRDLEIYFRVKSTRTEVQEGLGDRPVATASETPAVPPLLASFANRDALDKLLTLYPNKGPASKGANFADLTPEELRTYIYLTSQTSPKVASLGTQQESFESLMMRIPAGNFLMGTKEADVESIEKEYHIDSVYVRWETPQHQAYVTEYEIGKYPVTNFEYRAFVQDTKRLSPAHWNDGEYAEGMGDHPVVNVSWHDATAYCKWLSDKTGFAYRLPTEIEWERAARGDKGQVFPWGDSYEESYCNIEESHIGGPTPVGQYSPLGDSPYKVADMAGNVWEWTASWFNAYPDNNIEHEDYGKKYKVVRGGSFQSKRGDARCATRARFDPDSRNARTGFRCYRDSRLA